MSDSSACVGVVTDALYMMMSLQLSDVRERLRLDDGRILVKIVELVFVPISPVLAPEMPGDTNQHGIRDIGHTLKLGFTAFAAAIRLMAKAEPMEMADDFFELAIQGSDWFMNKEARWL